LNTDTHDRRPLIFLAVLMSHAVILLLVIRAARQSIASPRSADEPLVIVFLHEKAAPVPEHVTPRAAVPRVHAAAGEPVPDNAITVPPEVPPQPKIDWEHEAELAAQNGAALGEKETSYRDLSALSAAQLSWVEQNHMEPVQGGIEWQHPRFEFDRHSGVPILWINDHCVLVTLIVFCGIGHIEANGDLFKHMRDPRDP
jgi:hypothetical protein